MDGAIDDRRRDLREQAHVYAPPATCATCAACDLPPEGFEGIAYCRDFLEWVDPADGDCESWRD